MRVEIDGTIYGPISETQVCTHSIKEVRSYFAGSTPRLPRLGKGVSKTAYALPCGEHVLKVEHGGYANQMRAEINTWERVIGTNVERLLAPIVLYGTVPVNWSVQLWAAPRDWEDDVPGYGELTVECERAGLSDMHRQNCGVTRDGRWVCIDYGIGHVGDQENDQESEESEPETVWCAVCEVTHMYPSCEPEESEPEEAPDWSNQHHWCVQCNTSHPIPCHDGGCCGNSRNRDRTPTRKPVKRAKPKSETLNAVNGRCDCDWCQNWRAQRGIGQG